MKALVMFRKSRRTAFTLIELLVVIAIIAVLAGLLLAVQGALTDRKLKSTARAELNEIVTAIQAYHDKLGFYPPDNPTNAAVGPLYYELVGTLLTNDPAGRPIYLTLDGNTLSQVKPADLPDLFNVTSLQGDDQRSGPVNFLKDVRSLQLSRIGVAPTGGRVLICSVGWSKLGDNDAINNLCSWRYNSSHPTNNPNTYDLWVDIYIRGKTNRVCNWSKEPYVVP
jgi:prepilin-type N-terminal cleavage/methylation domain-containing protein